MKQMFGTIEEKSIIKTALVHVLMLIVGIVLVSESLKALNKYLLVNKY